MVVKSIECELVNYEEHRDKYYVTVKSPENDRKLYISSFEEVGCRYEEITSGRIAFFLGNELVGLMCSKCWRVREEWEFTNSKEEVWGKLSSCKECLSGRGSLHLAKRLARKNGLPDSETTSEREDVWKYFGSRCAISDKEGEIHADHVVPISIGHGGTVFGNMAPMDAYLNISKNASHIFEWFELNRERFNLEQSRFDALIAYLADANEMTTQEYRAYVDWCFDNPRVICDETGELVFRDGPINERLYRRKAIS